MNQRKNRRHDDRRSKKNHALERIEQLACFSELNVADFAPEDGLAYREAKHYGNRLKTSQLRKFFDAIKDIENRVDDVDDIEWDRLRGRFYLLQPKLAYARARDLVPEDFYRLMSTSMQKIRTDDRESFKEDYERFVRFLEAIVAYHKYVSEVRD